MSLVFQQFNMLFLWLTQVYIVVSFRHSGQAEIKQFVTKLPEEVRDNYYLVRKLVLVR